MMLEFFRDHWRDGVEILVLTFLVYYAYLLLHAAKRARLLLGLVVAMLGVIFLSLLLKLDVLLVVVKYLFGFISLALVVIFQPEMRRALVELGSRRFWRLKGVASELLEELCDSVQQLSNRRFGAIFAISREMDLADHAQTGVVLDAEISPELILTIFHPKTALHDGGMILKEGRIHSAGCVFPISHREFSDRSIGLRHRAAIGISEETDAIAIVVSEETGHISLCHSGQLERDLDAKKLKARLQDLLDGDDNEDEESSEEAGTEVARADNSSSTSKGVNDDKIA